MSSEPEGPVDGIASVDAESGALVLTLINRSLTTDTEVGLRFPAVNHAPVAESILLFGRDFTPASVFEPQSLSCKESDGGEVIVQLPKLSAARIVFADADTRSSAPGTQSP